MKNLFFILFLSFYRNGTFIAFLIIYFQYIHALFTIESWAIGASAGLAISIMISYLRDWIHLSNSFVTIIFVQLFQFIWFLFTSLIIYLKNADIDLILQKFWLFIPESIILSIISPYAFRLFHMVWTYGEQGELEGSK